MYKIEELMKIARAASACIDNEYVPARPLPWDYGCLFSRQRLVDAWEVFRGRADAVKWTGQ